MPAFNISYMNIQRQMLSAFCTIYIFNSHVCAPILSGFSSYLDKSLTQPLLIITFWQTSCPSWSFCPNGGTFKKDTWLLCSSLAKTTLWLRCTLLLGMRQQFGFPQWQKIGLPQSQQFGFPQRQWKFIWMPSINVNFLRSRNCTARKYFGRGQYLFLFHPNVLSLSYCLPFISQKSCVFLDVVQTSISGLGWQYISLFNLVVCNFEGCGRKNTIDHNLLKPKITSK